VAISKLGRNLILNNGGLIDKKFDKKRVEISWKETMQIKFASHKTTVNPAAFR
jgi:hypothetical protein